MKQGKGPQRVKTHPNTVKARCIVGPTKEIRGKVLFSPSPIAFLQGVDPEKGIVSDKDHGIFEIPFANKILVFPNAVGSSVGAYVIYRLKKNHMAPKAMINQASDIITASGCAISGIPLYDLPHDSIEILADANQVILNLKGELHVKSRNESQA